MSMLPIVEFFPVSRGPDDIDAIYQLEMAFFKMRILAGFVWKSTRPMINTDACIDASVCQISFISPTMIF